MFVGAVVVSSKFVDGDIVGDIVSTLGHEVGVAVGVDVGASTNTVSPTSTMGSSTARIALSALSEVRDVALFSLATDINVSEKVPSITVFFTVSDSRCCKSSSVSCPSTFDENAKDMVTPGEVVKDEGDGVLVPFAIEGEGDGD